MTEAMIMSRSGVDAGTATNPNDFIFHSAYNTFKIITQGSVTGTASAGTTTIVSVAHGQAAPPFVFSFIKWPDGLVNMPHSLLKGTGTNVLSTQVSNLSYYVDNSNINWSMLNNSGSSRIVKIAYYICETPATAGTP